MTYKSWEESIVATLSPRQTTILHELFEAGSAIYGGHRARSAEALVRLGCAERVGYAENGIRQKVRITKEGRDVVRYARALQDGGKADG